jgi:hypothetical protein
VAEAVEPAPGLEHEPLGLLKIPPSPWAAEPDPRPRRRVGPERQMWRRGLLRLGHAKPHSATRPLNRVNHRLLKVVRIVIEIQSVAGIQARDEEGYLP